jgi:hypothetical protein
MDLDVQKVQEFKDAIENTYWFEFFMGNIYQKTSAFSSIFFFSFQSIHLVLCSSWQMVLYDGG